MTPDDIHQKIREITAQGGYFEITETQVGGAAVSMFKSAPRDMLDVVSAGRQFNDQPFMVFEEYRYTFAQFYSEVDALSAYLQQTIGVQKGDRVAIAMQNCPHWSVAFYAILSVGAVAVPLNSWSTAEELQFLLTNADPACVIVDPRRLALIQACYQTPPWSILVTSQLGEVTRSDHVIVLDAALKAGSALTFEPVQVDPLAAAMIMYTSGSTGKSKGVVSSHRSVAQAIMNMLYLGFLTMSVEGVRDYRGGATSEAALLTVPLFHGTGLISGLLLPAFIGSKVVMLRKWDTERALELIDREKVTTLSSVPAILRDLITSPLRHRYSIESLLRVIAGGAAMPTDLPKLISTELPHASRSAGFGMTETVAVGAQMAGIIYDLYPSAAGIISPIMQFRIADADDREIDRQSDGEIQLRGVTCLTEYWRNPEATQRAFTQDGWLKTGDLGHINSDGFLFITGRSKEIVIRGGENISPNEIEDAAYQNLAVKECVVFGVADQRLGEELAMVVYLHSGSELEEHALREHLAGRLASFKVPRYITLRNEPLPRNNSEKLDKLACKRLCYPEG